MKTSIALLIFICSIQFDLTLASERIAENSSALLGKWIVDVSRLPIPPEAWPKQVTIDFATADGGKRKVDVDIINGRGKEIDATASYLLDGTTVAVSGSPEADTSSAKMPTKMSSSSRFENQETEHRRGYMPRRLMESRWSRLLCTTEPTVRRSCARIISHAFHHR